MNIKKMVIFFGACLVSSLSIADECASWGCTSTIETLYTNISGLVLVSTPLDETKANCTVYPGSYFVLNTDAQNGKEVYSSLLAAYMSNSKIQLRITEGSPNCELTYVRLSKKF